MRLLTCVFSIVSRSSCVKQHMYYLSNGVSLGLALFLQVCLQPCACLQVELMMEEMGDDGVIVDVGVRGGYYRM